MPNAYKTVLHPYFKLHYIKIAWGGAEDQAAEREAGNIFAKNGQEEALKIVETAVSNKYFYIFVTDTECLAERQRSNAILDG
jgi:hypothetical protein